MRYSILHEPGVKPPKNTLDAQRWADLAPASKKGSVCTLRHQSGETYTVAVSKHTEQVLRTLSQRPMKSASRCRISQYVSALREMNVAINTEGYRSADDDRESYGVYVLQDTLVDVSS